MQTRFKHFIINLIMSCFIGFPFLHAKTEAKMRMEVLELKKGIIYNLENDFKVLKSSHTDSKFEGIIGEYKTIDDWIKKQKNAIEEEEERKRQEEEERQKNYHKLEKTIDELGDDGIKTKIKDIMNNKTLDDSIFGDKGFLGFEKSISTINKIIKDMNSKKIFGWYDKSTINQKDTIDKLQEYLNQEKQNNIKNGINNEIK